MSRHSACVAMRHSTMFIFSARYISSTLFCLSIYDSSVILFISAFISAHLSCSISFGLLLFASLLCRMALSSSSCLQCLLGFVPLGCLTLGFLLLFFSFSSDIVQDPSRVLHTVCVWLNRSTTPGNRCIYV